MPKHEYPLISVVILNWNGLEDTKECIKSLQNNSYPNFEVIIVDNGSSDGSKEWLSQQKDIRYVDLPKNLGVTGGHIEGLKSANASAKFIANLNNDAVVDSEWLMSLYEPMAKDTRIAVTGGKAFEWDDQNKLFNINNTFFTYQVIDAYRGYAHTMRSGDKQAPVNSISTVGALMRRSAIDKVGYFDNDFFAYYDETDLFARFKRAGYKIVYTPDAMLWHQIGASSKGVPYFYIYQMFRNRFIFGVKNYDDKYLQAFIRQYTRDALPSVVRRFLGSKDLLHKAHTNAFFWNMLRFYKTYRKRNSVKQLGPKYNELLLDDASEFVSVVIPNYNYGKYVGLAIESVLRQSQKAFEIIVIDDGSTDNSREIIKKYAQDNDAIRTIFKQNAGVIAAKNQGLLEATGEWIIFLDADDELGENYIKDCLRFARSENKDVVYTDVVFTGSRKGKLKARPFSKVALLFGNFAHNSSLYRKSLIHKAGGYNPAMDTGWEDWELNISLMEAGARFGYLKKSNFFYRQHPGSVSRNNDAAEDGRRLTKIVHKLHRKSYLKYGFFLTMPGRVVVLIIRRPMAVVLLPYWVIRAGYPALRAYKAALSDYMSRFIERKSV